MFLGKFGTKMCSKILQIGYIDRALTRHVGVESRCEIANTPFVVVHEQVDILIFLPDHLQHTEPRRNY